MIRVIDHYRPKIFVAENVDGIRSKKDPAGNKMNKSALEVITEDFNRHGYLVQSQVLLAADFGVPQMRKRVIMIGIREDLGTLADEYYPEQIYSENGTTTNGRCWLTSFDGIEDLSS